MIDDQLTPASFSIVTDLSLAAIKPTSDGETMLKILGLFGTSNPRTPGEMVLLKMQLIERLLGVEHICVGEMTSNEWRVIQSHGLWAARLTPGTILPLEDTLCQYVKATGQLVVIPDTATDIRAMDLLERNDLQAAAYIGAPLYDSDGTLFGTLFAIDLHPRTFSSAEIALIQLVVGEIAYIIEREGLLQRVLRAANEADDDLGATLNVLDQQQTVLRVVAHDLRTPLTAVFTGSAALLQGMLGPLDPPKQRVVDLMDKASRFMSRLVNDLMDASEAEDPTLALVAELFDAVAVGHELVKLCEVRAQEAGLWLELDATIDSSTMVGDRERLLQILLNLVGNAIVYTPSGGITLRISGDEEQVLFEVIDTGPGIPPEDLHRIWEPHVRMSRRGRGLGLGLYVVALLARKMGGTAGVRSTLGVGSTFWLRLPRVGPRPQVVPWNS